MSTANKAALINTVLLVVVALMGGGIAGYLVGQNQSPATTATTTPVQIGVPMNDVLPVEDVWIVEGFSCPTPGCINPLLTCSHPLARQIRDWVNKQVATGRDGQSIRAEIIQVNGAGLNNLPPDTL